MEVQESSGWEEPYLSSQAVTSEGKSRVALYFLLKANRMRFMAYFLKEYFGHLCSYMLKMGALKFFRGWVAQLK